MLGARLIADELAGISAGDLAGCSKREGEKSRDPTHVLKFERMRKKRGGCKPKPAAGTLRRGDTRIWGCRLATVVVAAAAPGKRESPSQPVAGAAGWRWPGLAGPERTLFFGGCWLVSKLEPRSAQQRPAPVFRWSTRACRIPSPLFCFLSRASLAASTRPTPPRRRLRARSRCRCAHRPSLRYPLPQALSPPGGKSSSCRWWPRT